MDSLKATSLVINPDGVEFKISREALKVNCSFFVPCVDYSKAVTDLRGACHCVITRKWKFDYEVRIEKGKLGVRFWRVI